MDQMSNYYYFLTVAKETQAAQVWKYGTFLERTVKRNKAYWLYSLYGFYVELLMTANDETILDVRPFRDAARLDKYLGNIDLERLLAA